MPQEKKAVGETVRELLIGKEVDLGDRRLFQRFTLIAFFAWVGLGADGLSSSCYGPSEVWLTLGDHTILALLVGVMTVATIFIITASYSQIIELFPHGGGGYLVASRLLSPKLGMISGCALIIDYVLTITLSIASGADALLSLLPSSFHAWKEHIAVAGIVLLTFINLRGVKESVKLLLPIFLLFVITHAFGILYGLTVHAMDMPAVTGRLAADVARTQSELGWLGLVFLLLKAFSMGAGTYTGIEAVSNGMPILREPRVQTAQRTMLYIALSLSFMVMGLMLAYVLFNVRFAEGKTLNAALFASMTEDWPAWLSRPYLLLTLASEALLLFVAAQTGFLDGPRIMANMALDRWLPSRFSMLSDRLVTQNGILCLSGAALIVMLATDGKVSSLVVLYSINVFITFVLSQAGMVRHWWQEKGRAGRWLRKLCINCVGLVICFFILLSIIAVKFEEGAWLTLVVTGLLAGAALYVKQRYTATGRRIAQLEALKNRTEQFGLPVRCAEDQPLTTTSRTAVLLVGGYNGLGISALLSLLAYHGQTFRRLIFLQIGVVDASVFHSGHGLEDIKESLKLSTQSYVDMVEQAGFAGQAIWAVGTDVVEEVKKLAPALHENYPRSVFFAGQIVFQKESLVDRLLHNSQSFALQRDLSQMGIPFELLPVAMDRKNAPGREEPRE